MARQRASIHGQWSSRMAFVLAATGSAVGLGNIWKFPYIAGENGGGAFVLVYLICIAMIGIPIMIAEVMLGRRGRQSPINTMRALAGDEAVGGHWELLGWAGVAAGFLIMSYYSVVAGEALAYVFRTASGMFDGATADGVHSIFRRFVSDPEALLAWHTIFSAMTMIVVARGVRSGLEQAVRFMMPALLVLLLLLVGYAMDTGRFVDAVKFLFQPDFTKITAGGVLVAMGHSFFTLSLGMGAIMVYGSYLRTDTSIAKTTVLIALADTAVALLAGLAIFPIVFSHGLQPAQGPGLIFQTLPLAFGHMPGGTFFGSCFFVLLVFAAWSSAISLIEPAVAWLVENRGVSRVNAVVWVGTLAWLLGIASIYSAAGVTLRDIVAGIGGLFGVHGLQLSAGFYNMTVFGLIDYLTANIMLPLGGLSIAVFAGWAMRRRSVEDELDIRNPWLFGLWYTVVRFVTPIAVIVVFLKVTGLLDWLDRVIGF
jgi:NSS family neurotransmitter:Na+ symporter